MTMRQKTLQAGVQAAKGLVVSSLCVLMIAGPGTQAPTFVTFPSSSRWANDAASEQRASREAWHESTRD